MKYSFIPMLHLQLFAEGGAGAAGVAGDGGTAQGSGVTAAAAVPQVKGVKSNPLADVKYGVQPEEGAPAAEVQKATETPPDLNAEFESLIKGKYKQQYNERMQSTIQQRLKGNTQIVERYNSMAPMLEMLGAKYGTKADDIEGLIKAIQDDDAFYEDEASRRDMSVEQLKQLKKMERENDALRRQMQESKKREDADNQYATWFTQAESAKQVYPTFDLKTEIGNPEFIRLLDAGVDVRTAYEVIHRDEIIPAAMAFAVKTTEEKIARKVAANGARPSENGMGAQAATTVKSDVSKLNKADIREIQRRVANGERISFG